MPHVHFTLRRRPDPDFAPAVSRAVHRALTETFGIRDDDLLHVFDEHDGRTFAVHPTYLGTPRTEDFVLVEVYCNPGRSAEVKRAFYRRAAELLRDGAGVAPDDVVVRVVEVPRENWSLGGGLMQGD